MDGWILLSLHIIAAALYVAAIISGWRALRRLVIFSAFRWCETAALFWRWIQYRPGKAPILWTHGESEWAPLWIALYFSVANSVVAFLLICRLIVVSDYSEPSRIAFYYVPLHFGTSIGAIALHLGAFVLLLSRRDAT